MPDNVIPIQRGKILHPERRLQIVDYSKMKWKKITPTDIDGFNGNDGMHDIAGLIEYQQRCYVLIEIKHEGNTIMPRGQEIALCRMVDDLHKSRPAILFLAAHAIPIGQEIPAHECRVVSWYFKSEWKPANKIIRLGPATSQFIAKYGKS